MPEMETVEVEKTIDLSECQDLEKEIEDAEMAALYAPLGCHILSASTPWVSHIADLTELTDDLSALMELSIDAESGTLTFVNKEQQPLAFYVTVRNHTCRAFKTGAELTCGESVEDGKKKRCTTFIAAVQPLSAIDVCCVGDGDVDLEAEDFISDIQPMSLNSKDVAKSSTDSKVLAWPFPEATPGKCESFECVQAFGGSLTHFAHANTYFAVDFKCPMGTEVASCTEGTVVGVRLDSTHSGIAVDGFFDWNAVSVEHEDGSIIDYVHIKDSHVKVGDHVQVGDALCTTGCAGFCPEPHLHLQVNSSRDPAAPSVPIAFDINGDVIVPRLGVTYPAKTAQAA